MNTFTPFTESTATDIEILTREEKKEQAKRYRNLFLALGQLLIMNQKTFDVRSMYGIRQDLPIKLIDEWFAPWAKEMEAASKLKSIDGIDGKLYISQCL